jgi:hypothetical protein
MAVVPYAPELDIDALLASKDPFGALHGAVRDRVSSGAPRDKMLDVLDDTRRRLTKVHRETDSETVADVMDCLVGWCGPSARI